MFLHVTCTGGHRQQRSVPGRPPPPTHPPLIIWPTATHPRSSGSTTHPPTLDHLYRTKRPHYCRPPPPAPLPSAHPQYPHHQHPHYPHHVPAPPLPSSHSPSAAILLFLFKIVQLFPVLRSRPSVAGAVGGDSPIALHKTLQYSYTDTLCIIHLVKKKL